MSSEDGYPMFGAFLLNDAALDVLAELVAERLRVDDERDSEWLDAQGAADFLGVPVSRVYRWRAHGIPTHHDGSLLRFSRTELDRWRRNGGKA